MGKENRLIFADEANRVLLSSHYNQHDSRERPVKDGTKERVICMWSKQKVHLWGGLFVSQPHFVYMRIWSLGVSLYRG